MEENIMEGLKFAVSRGDSIEEAMQSFYNAGYSREDIEYAARELQNQFQIEQRKGIHAIGPSMPSESGMRNTSVKSETRRPETDSPKQNSGQKN